MTGSLQIKSGMFYTVIRIPDSTGHDQQKWESTGVEEGEKGEKRDRREKAKAILHKRIADYETQQVTYSKEILFLDWFDTWMEQKRDEIRPNTWECYDLYMQKHIIPYFKPLKLKLREVNALHIQRYYNTKRKTLAANTIQKHSVLIRGALKEAVRKKLIPYNPVDGATLPKRKRYRGKAYTVDQANALMSAIGASDVIKPAIVLGLFYGLRRSEVCGLRWRDIDFKAGKIYIRNTVVRMTSLIEGEQTKSEASTRTLYFIPETKDYFLNLYRLQKENCLLLGNVTDFNQHVCVWDDGSPLLPAYVSRRFKKVLVKNGLPIIRFHDLRHTAGSLLLSKGVSIKQVQEFLGHELASTTLDIYGHVYDESKQETANVMGGLLAAGNL